MLRFVATLRAASGRLIQCHLRHSQMALAISAAAILVTQTTSAQCVEPKPADRPNIVLIMADDMGFSDLGCYGGEINTPTLSGLAKGGLRFTQFYNTGRCCPTRASLLTGLYPHQAGIGWMTTDRGHDGYRGDLNRRCATIAEVLGSSGYATFMAGKWHVTKATQPDGPRDNWPRQRGFDRFYGTITGAGSFYDPGTLTRDNTMISPLADSEYQPDCYYYTDAISDHAVRYIQEHAAARQQDQERQQPFFLYVAYTAAHWPMHALPEDIARYEGKYADGYEPIRKQRVERMRQMGLIDPAWEVAPQIGNWETEAHKAWEARCMEVYAAMVDRMDQGIGKIVQSLRDSGQFEDTLILFLQDNGGCQETVGRKGDSQRPVAASLPRIADDAIRLDVIPRQNRAGVPTLQGPGIMPGPEDTYIAYGLHWANVSNTPFREYKHFVHEGGIATPLIAHWPKRIRRRGELESQPGHLIDLMATCVDVAGAAYPTELNGQAIYPAEGTSLAAAFDGKQLGRKQPLFWEHEGNRAVRDGRWKLVAKENKPWELYDMQSDRTEMHDLAADEPERAMEMAAAWDVWAARAQVLPLGTWRGASNARFNKKQRKFQLEADAELSRQQAPFVEGRALAITVDVKKAGTEGVLVAQGGSTVGYALYLKQGQLCFAIRNGGKLSMVATNDAKLSDARRFEAALQKDGSVTLTADAKQVAQGQVSGVLESMPLDGLQVGRDTNGAVGQYAAPFPFQGAIEQVTIQLR